MICGTVAPYAARAEIEMESQPGEIAVIPEELRVMQFQGPGRLLRLLRSLHIAGLSIAIVLALLTMWLVWQVAVVPGLFAGIFLLGLLAVRVASKADEIRREETESPPGGPGSGLGVTGTVATCFAVALLLVGFIGGPLLVYESYVALQEIFRIVAETCADCSSNMTGGPPD